MFAETAMTKAQYCFSKRKYLCPQDPRLQAILFMFNYKIEFFKRIEIQIMAELKTKFYD